MFDTIEPPQQFIALRWSFLLYISYGFFGLGFFLIDVWKHAVSHPLRLALSIAMFILAMTWLVVTLRTRRPLTNRAFSIRNIIFVVLLLAHTGLQG